MNWSFRKNGQTCPIILNSFLHLFIKRFSEKNLKMTFSGLGQDAQDPAAAGKPLIQTIK